MVKKIILFLAASVAISSFAATTFSLTNASYSIYQDDYIKATDGKMSVLVVDSLHGDSASLTISSTTADSLYSVKWYSYTAEEPDKLSALTSFDVKGAASTVKGLRLNQGYKAVFMDSTLSDSTIRNIWLAEYMPIDSIKWNDSTAVCENLVFEFFPTMSYVSLLGLPVGIQRTVSAAYDVYKMSEGELIETATTVLSGDRKFILNEVPTVNTVFTLSDVDHDDVFTSDTFFTSAVNAFPQILTDDKAENEADEDDGFKRDSEGNVVYYFDGTATFRSSGPLYIDLKSNASPYADDIQWHVATDSAFTNPYVIYNKPNIFNYKFSKPGTYCIKLVVKNNASGCDYESAGCFKIVSSALYIPNTFTPNGDGKNDEFKVAYTSITSYSCRIYTQWGKKVFDSDDITRGWDGKIGGSNAPTGVYFYVIYAKGNDGVEYNKKGTVNLLRSVD